MSVAFRRESDEEHLEPKFERPVPPGPNLVTPRGLDLIAAEVARIEAALANAAEADRPVLVRDLRYWRTRLATAQVAPPPTGGEVGIGSRVDFQLDGRAQTVAIVGADEADPDAGRIGFAAPLARALMGAGEGDIVAFGDRPDAIEIVSVTS